MLSYVGFFAFLSFAISVGAAALAINLYALLRTGQTGASWRILIIASVMFAGVQAMRLLEIVGVPELGEWHLSSIIELAFVLALAYAFWLQRQVFAGENRRDRRQTDRETEPEIEAEEISSYEDYS